MSKLDRILALKKELDQLKIEADAATAPPKQHIFKPNGSTDFFWPATRARNILKEVARDGPRQTFDKNIRALAQKTGTTPESVLKTNPIVVGRRLGISEWRLSQIIGNYYILINHYPR